MKNINKGLLEGKSIRELTLVESQDLTQEQFDAVDWSGLEKILSDYLGVTITLSSTFTPERGRLKVESQDLVSESGIFAKALKSVRVESFNYGYVDSDNSLWLTLTISFDILSGGSNGISLLTTWFKYEDKTWIAQNDKGEKI